MNAKKLYRFRSRFGKEYNITDEKVIERIESLLENGDTPELCEYLYNLVIERLGVIEFIKDIEHKIAQERNIGYRSGKKQMQQDMRELLGV